MIEIKKTFELESDAILFLNALEMHSDLLEIYNLSRNALKHDGDYEKVLEQIKSIAAR